jgi:hypothetical protein
MNPIGKKVGSFFEGHIEKVVLGVVGLVCIWLFKTFVLFSPNTVPYEKKEFSPSEIDPYIRTQAQKVEFEMKQSAMPGRAAEPQDKPQVDRFLAMMDCSIRDVNTNLVLPLPYNSSTALAGRAPYKLPEIGGVTDVAAGHIRAAAYVPVVPITQQYAYDKNNSEPNDIDLVTVEGKYSVAALYEEFRRCFTGADVPIEWRDPCLANPIFAAVQLQRQELLQDGSWGNWQVVPRARIESRRQMFEAMQDTENLPPGGIKVQLLQFDNPDVRMDLLQPMAYQIASADVEWFPPSLHKKFEDLLRKEKLEDKRKALEEKKQGDERQPGQRLEDRRGSPDRSGLPGGVRPGATRPSTTRSSTATGPGGIYQGPQGLAGTRERPTRGRSERGTSGTGRTGPGVYDDSGLYGQTGVYDDRDRRGRSRTRDQRDVQTDYLMNPRNIPTGPSTGDVYYEYDDILMTRRTDLSKMREPLVFWAHDDTVGPTKTYRYRIRLGVFNPAAGASQSSKQNNSEKNQVLFWSNFSNVTEAVHIPARLYFFANEIQEAAKTVTVQVSKYVLGYWHSQEFRVRPGEVIGKVVETEVPKKEDRTKDRRLAFAMGAPILPKDKPVVPETIDYGTGAVLVDAVAVNDWAGPGQLRPSPYHDMLYTYDGMDIEHMPVKASNWPAQLVAAFYDIQKAQREPPQPFRDWDSRLSAAKKRPPMMEGYEGLDEEYMMMEEMYNMQQPGPGRR